MNIEIRERVADSFISLTSRYREGDMEKSNQQSERIGQPELPRLAEIKQSLVFQKCNRGYLVKKFWNCLLSPHFLLFHVTEKLREQLTSDIFTRPMRQWLGDHRAELLRKVVDQVRE